MARFLSKLLEDYEGDALSEEKAALLQELPMPLMLLDRQNVCRFVNHYTEVYTGYRAAEIVGLTHADLWVSFYKRAQEQQNMELNRDGQVTQKSPQDAPIYDKNGYLLWLNREIIPLLGPDGDVCGRMVVGYPTPSDEERSVITLHDAAFLLDSMNCGVFIVDRDGVVTMVNEACLSMFNTTRERMLGRTLVDFALKLDGDSLLYRTLVEGVEFSGVQRVYAGKTVNVSTKLLRSCEGTILGATAVFQDVTQMIRLEKMSLIGQMAAGFAHEIRNPMTTVRGFVQVLFENPERAVLYRELVLEELDRINRLVNDFLLATRPSFPEKQQVGIDSLIDETMKFMQNEAAMHGINLSHAAKELPAYVEIDRAQVKQVLLNLIKNAIEAMPGGGDVLLESHQDDEANWVVVRIVDNGPGIPPEIVEQIGQPFFTTKQDGTGLGLSISRRIIESHSGTLQVESGAEGTTVTIRLPAHSRRG